jgi:hypothetical protein
MRYRPWDVEADAIRLALVHPGGRVSEVSRRLRVGRSTLHCKRDILGLAIANIADALELRCGDTCDKNEMICEQKRARLLNDR